MRISYDGIQTVFTPGRGLLLFFLFSFAGWCWETSLYLVKEHRLINRGFLSGPFLPIYGFGAMLLLGLCLPLAQRPLLACAAGMIAASAFEYAAGAAIEKLLYVRYWDYTGSIWSIGGHVCLLSALTWAAMTGLLIYGIWPAVYPVIARVPDAAALAAGGMLCAYAGVDAIASLRLKRRCVAAKEGTA